MTIQQPITLDLSLKSPTPVIHAVQDDENTRVIVASLTVNGAAFTPPVNATAEFRLAKPDGTYCFYDADENNDPVVTIDGSTVSVVLLAAALQAAGIGKAQIDLYDTDGRLATFTFLLDIEAATVPDGAISETYVNVITPLVNQAVTAATAAEAAQAAAEAAANDTVKVTSQSFNSTQKQQARSNIDAVGTSLTINGYTLTEDRALSASDVGAVDATISTGTITVTGGTLSGNSALVKNGSTVDMNFDFTPNTTIYAGSSNAFATIPSAYCPRSSYHFVPAYQGNSSGAYPILITITDGGAIYSQIEAIASGTRIRFSASWLV